MNSLDIKPPLSPMKLNFNSAPKLLALDNIYQRQGYKPLSSRSSNKSNNNPNQDLLDDPNIKYKPPKKHKHEFDYVHSNRKRVTTSAAPRNRKVYDEIVQLKESPEVQVQVETNTFETEINCASQPQPRSTSNANPRNRILSFQTPV